MDDKRIFDERVKGVRDFEIWRDLFDLGYICLDVNRDKKFICPATNQNCEYKSVLYFEKTDDIEDILKMLYENLEREKKLKEDFNN